MNKSSNQTDLATGSIGHLLFAMAVPAISAQLINVLYNVVDRIYIGHIPGAGTDALTGVGVSLPIIVIITAFSSLIGMGGAPQAAISMGKGDNKTAEKILGTCTSSIAIVSIILTLIVLLTQNKLLMLLGASPQTIGYAVDYLTIYCLGTIFMQTVLALNPFITTQGFASIAMRTTLLGAVVNIILDPILIFGFNMGVKGAAIATVFSQALSAIWVIKFLLGKKTLLRIRKKYLVPNKKILLSVVALGVSPFIMQATESLITICFNTSLQAYGGDIAVGAMTILASCMQFAMLPLMGLTQGAQPIISYNYGAGNRERVSKAFKLLLMSCIIFTLSLCTLVFFLPQVFVGMFTNSPELMAAGKWAIRIYMFGTGIFGIQIACQQTFIALGEAKISVFLAVLRKIILLIPFIYILPLIVTPAFAAIFTSPSIAALFTIPDKVFAVFFAEPLADIIAVLVTAIMFKLNFRKILDKMPDSKKEAIG